VIIHRMLSHDAAALFPDEHFDWAYIDASHFYDDVKRDLEAFFPKLRKGGYFAGDDYDRRGIWDHGVTRAVDEFRLDPLIETIRLKNHQFLIRKR
jgi:Methyltransferase domain